MAKTSDKIFSRSKTLARNPKCANGWEFVGATTDFLIDESVLLGISSVSRVVFAQSLLRKDQVMWWLSLLRRPLAR